MPAAQWHKPRPEYICSVVCHLPSGRNPYHILIFVSHYFLSEMSEIPLSTGRLQYALAGMEAAQSNWVRGYWGWDRRNDECPMAAAICRDAARP
jgi:hypothetical protein